MSSVARQSIYTTGLTYVGVAIGYVNLLYLFPTYLSLEQLGLYRLVQDMAILAMPLAHAGLVHGVIKYMPEFKRNSTAYRNFTGSVLATAFLAFLVLGLGFYALQPLITKAYASKSPELTQHFLLVYLLIGLMAFTAIAEAFFRAILETVLPNLLREVGIRLLTTLTLLAYIAGWLNFSQLLYSLLFVYGTGLLILLLVLYQKKVLRPAFSFWQLPAGFLKNLIKYSLIMVPSASGLMMVGKIDFLMIGAYIGPTATGIYTISFYIATIIEMPKRALAQLITPLYARAFKRNHQYTIERLYKQSALSQQMIAQWVFLGIVINLVPLYHLIPKGEELQLGFWVVWIAGLAKVADASFGLNGELIVMSRYYRFILMAMIGLILIAVLSNLVLIPAFGINGAALATMLTLLYYNLAKAWFIHHKFGYIPFGWKNLQALLAAAACLALVYYLMPGINSSVLDILLRSVLITLLYGGSLLLLGLIQPYLQLLGNNNGN